MQSWILIVGFLVIAGIGLDLLRRMRNAGRDSFEMDLNMQQGLDTSDPLSADDSGTLPELPNGGARSIDRSGDTGKREDKSLQRGDKSLQPDKKSLQRHGKSFQQTPETDRAEEAASRTEPSVPMLMDADLGSSDEQYQTSFLDDDPLMGGSSPILSRPRVVPRESSKPEEHQEVIVINVMAKTAEERGSLGGAALLETVLACGLRFGDMNIFHYHLSDDDETALFSMANILKPGTFDLNNMDSFQTPGVSLFMTLPLQGENVSAMETFDKMLACAKKIADNLNGELRDERRSVMTGQTIEHCRQRISEFARLHLSRSGKLTTS